MTDSFQEASSEEETKVLDSEVRAALRPTERNKSPGKDGISTETESIKILTRLCLQIWKTKQWPADWKSSVYIPIPKKMPKPSATIRLIH